jgi:hypothetical protein
MPNRFDMQCARPLCRRRRMERKGQHGLHFTCYTARRYERTDSQWWCPVCLTEAAGELVAGRVRAVRAGLA